MMNGERMNTLPAFLREFGKRSTTNTDCGRNETRKRNKKKHREKGRITHSVVNLNTFWHHTKRVATERSSSYKGTIPNTSEIRETLEDEKNRNESGVSICIPRTQSPPFDRQGPDWPYCPPSLSLKNYDQGTKKHKKLANNR